MGSSVQPLRKEPTLLQEGKRKNNSQLCRECKAVGPNIEPTEGGVRTGKGSVQYGRERNNGGANGQIEIAMRGMNHYRRTSQKYIVQRRGNTEVHSTIAER